MATRSMRWCRSCCAAGIKAPPSSFDSAAVLGSRSMGAVAANEAVVPGQGQLQEGLQPLGSDPVHPAVKAFQEGNLAFAFSGGGFLLPYFVGVIQSLRSMGLLAEGCHVCGSSAGSLVAASVASGITPEDMMDAFRTTVRNVRNNGVSGRLSGVLLKQLEAQLPDDAHVRASGRTHIAITRLFPMVKSKIVSHFSSRQELISALMASCHIPRISNGDFTTEFRGKTVMDGGVTLLIPTAPAPHYTVKISCIPRAHLRQLPLINKKATLDNLAFSPDEYAPWPMTVRQLLTNALAPGPDEFLQELMSAGASDASRWALSVGLADKSRAAAAHLAATPHIAAAGTTPGVASNSSAEDILIKGSGGRAIQEVVADVSAADEAPVAPSHKGACARIATADNNENGRTDISNMLHAVLRQPHANNPTVPVDPEGSNSGSSNDSQEGANGIGVAAEEGGGAGTSGAACKVEGMHKRQGQASHEHAAKAALSDAWRGS